MGAANEAVKEGRAHSAPNRATDVRAGHALEATPGKRATKVGKAQTPEKPAAMKGVRTTAKQTNEDFLMAKGSQISASEAEVPFRSTQITFDEETLRRARLAGMHSALMNLAQRPEILAIPGV